MEKVINTDANLGLLCMHSYATLCITNLNIYVLAWEYLHVALCEPVCQNHGRCIAPNVCECATGWEGNLCQHRKSGFYPIGM